MNNYLTLASRRLGAHKKNTRLTVISVMIAVALVTTIFSMLDTFWRFEKQQVINDFGSYHILIKDITDGEAAAISARLDVDTASKYIGISAAKMDGIPVEIATSESLALIYSAKFSVIEGSLPKEGNEIAVEQWAAESYKLKIGDTLGVTSGNGARNGFRVTGICTDFSATKAERVPGLLVTVEGAQAIDPGASVYLIIKFKEHVKINRAENEIKQQLNIADDRIARNERLLALTGQSVNSTVWGMYGTGAVLFLLVLIAGVTMIYNTFNISVMDRIRQFGLLRCIGASRKQVKRLVRKEARLIALRAIPPGIATGLIITFASSAILKFFNSSLFSGIPVINVSAAGIIAGLAIGTLTVFFASLSPAKKASQVSPVSAVTGSGGARISAKAKKGALTSLFHAETAMGIRNAAAKKKTLVLMSASIAISIILFLGFQVFISFMYAGMKTDKPYTADITLTSESGLDYGLYTELSSLEGVKRVYGRMFGYTDATFDASRLTDAYKREIGDIRINADDSFIAPEQSAVISYDKNQLKWAKTDLIEGTLSEDRLNQGSGLVAVALNTRNGISMETVSLRLGDKVTMATASGSKEYTVMAILRSVPFADEKHVNLTTFITTEKLYTEITGDSTLDVIDIQMKRGDQSRTVAKIKSMTGDDVKLYDARQKNSEATQAFLTAAIFVYGFVLVIALISILNIINTMQTSVAAKTKYLGVMRAIGMSGRQLDRMILCEAGTYSVTGCVAGVVLGLALQRFLITGLLSGAHMKWQLPLTQVIIIIAMILLITLISVIGPLKKVKAKGISENIGALQ